MSIRPPPLFANADFLRLWSIGLITFMVRWLEMLAVSLFVYHATGSALLVAMMGMLRMLPMGLLGAAVGALAERVEARSALIAIVASSVLTSGVLALLAWTGQLAVWHLGLASFINGVSWTADAPVRRLMIGEVVGTSRMTQAMSADVVNSNASRMLGPLLGGVVFAAAGIEGTFVCSVLLYVGALYAALTLRYRKGVNPVAGEPLLARIREGIAVTRRDPRLRAALDVTLIYNVFGWPLISLIPVIGQDHLRLEPGGIGLLAGMDGAGAFVGALAMAAWARPGNYAKCYIGGAVIYMIGTILFALSPVVVAAGAALLLCGFVQAGFSVMQTTLIYLWAPPQMRSRVLGLLSVCIGIGPLGFLHVGLLADAIGANWACVVSAAEGLLTMLLTRRWWRDLLGARTH
jgi:MFS family permease